MEDYGLDVWMEDSLNGGYGYTLDEMGDEFDTFDSQYWTYDEGQWDDDPSPYNGDYSEE